MRKVRLEEIVQATKVNIRCLKALEADDLQSLPGTVFTRGFVRSYARAIGLDPDEAILQLEDYLRENASKNGHHKSSSFNVEFGWRLKLIVWVVMGFIAIVTMAYLLR